MYVWRKGERGKEVTKINGKKSKNLKDSKVDIWETLEGGNRRGKKEIILKSQKT